MRLLIPVLLLLPVTALAENSFNLSYSQTSGNSNTSTLSFSYSLTKEWDGKTVSSQGSYLYKKSSGEESANRLEVDNSYEKEINKLLSFTLNNFIFSDRFSGYNLRIGAGPGLKLKISNNLSVSTTATYVYNNYTKNPNKSYYQGEMDINYSKELTDGVTFSQLLSYQVSFSNSKDFFLQSKSQVSVPISEKLSLTVTYQVDYQNLLPEGVNYHTDKLFLTGISYSF